VPNGDHFRRDRAEGAVLVGDRLRMAQNIARRCDCGFFVKIYVPVPLTWSLQVLAVFNRSCLIANRKLQS